MSKSSNLEFYCSRTYPILSQNLDPYMLGIFFPSPVHVKLALNVSSKPVTRDYCIKHCINLFLLEIFNVYYFCNLYFTKVPSWRALFLLQYCTGGHSYFNRPFQQGTIAGPTNPFHVKCHPWPIRSLWQEGQNVGYPKMTGNAVLYRLLATKPGHQGRRLSSHT